MTKEFSKKNEEIRKYHAEHAVVFSQIRELVGHPGQIVNKAYLYDRMMESGELASAKKTLPILVKYVGVHFFTLIRNYKNTDPYSVFYHGKVRIIWFIRVN